MSQYGDVQMLRTLRYEDACTLSGCFIKGTDIIVNR